MSSRDPKPADPGGIVFNKIARDARLRRHATPTTRSRTSRQKQVQDIFSGRDPQLERGRRARTVTGPIDLVVRTAASGTQDAFQNIFMGQNLRRRRRARRRSRPTASCSRRSSATRTRSATSRFDFTERHARGALQGRRLQPAQRQVRPVRAACVTSGWSRRGTRQGRGEEVHRLGPQRSPAVAEQHRRAATGCRSRSDARRGSRPAAGRTARRARARRGWPASCCVADRRDDRLRLQEGVAVVRRTTGSPGSARAATSTCSSRRSSTRPPNPDDYVYTLRAWPLLYGHGRSPPAARSLIGLVFSLLRGDLHRRVRAARGCARMLEPVVRLLAGGARRSSTG